MIRNSFSNLKFAGNSAQSLSRNLALAALGASSAALVAGSFAPAQAVPVSFSFNTRITSGNTGLGNDDFRGFVRFDDRNDLSRFRVEFGAPVSDISALFTRADFFEIGGDGTLNIISLREGNSTPFFNFDVGDFNFTLSDLGSGDFLSVNDSRFNVAQEPITFGEPVPEPVTTAGAIAAVVGMTAAARRKRREAAVEEA